MDNSIGSQFPCFTEEAKYRMLDLPPLVIVSNELDIRRNIKDMLFIKPAFQPVSTYRRRVYRVQRGTKL